MKLQELDKTKDYVLVVTAEEFETLRESSIFNDRLQELERKVKSITIMTDVNNIEEYKTIRFKLLHPAAQAPSRGHEDDTGFDLVTAWVEPFVPARTCDVPTPGLQSYKLHMGVAVAPPEGYYFDMRPRSSFSKSGYVLGNSLGTIDKGYRGELMAIIHPTKEGLPAPLAGERHFQLVLQKYENDFVILKEVDEFEQTARGEGGFGSTGK